MTFTGELIEAKILHEKDTAPLSYWAKVESGKLQGYEFNLFYRGERSELSDKVLARVDTVRPQDLELLEKGRRVLYFLSNEYEKEVVGLQNDEYAILAEWKFQVDSVEDVPNTREISKVHQPGSLQYFLFMGVFDGEKLGYTILGNKKQLSTRTSRRPSTTTRAVSAYLNRIKKKHKIGPRFILRDARLPEEELVSSIERRDLAVVRAGVKKKGLLERIIQKVR